ncbi:MAG: 16S rRNA (cytosine(1402)-N(4))-methyltransferase RsmH [Chloroflexi bacterium]|nr:16S rRNA (cytosine(1402)-N(4))-methyltransferase RsmH [Chloroflexota bacterium]MCY3958801.1 16S rRNA (cytosine(1402)-N(4))-methyltransferase RsmH [Chloroflexota bacterium]
MTAGPSRHEPVLPEAVVEALRPCLNGLVVDGTAGLGGHTEALLDAGATRVVAIDLDPDAVHQLARRFRDDPRVQPIHASYADLPQMLGAERPTGVLLDLGMSSRQVTTAERGFSFRLKGPLDMRFDATAGAPAARLVNRLPEDELAALLRDYGEERRARAVARRIVASRPLESTTQLARVVAGAFPGRRRLHPATRTFQALRIATNEELEVLDQGLAGARLALRAGGRLAVIAFHSLEDRIVKRAFRTWAGDGAGEVLTRRPIRSGRTESRRNPRARSARLRVFAKANGD